MRKEIRSVLVELSQEDLGKAYVELNSWKWPSCLASFKPAKWEEWGLDEKKENDHGAMEMIKELTSVFGRSQAWWKYALNRSEEMHKEWWISEKVIWHELRD